jgi:ribosomal protein L11 methyltransferase
MYWLEVSVTADKEAAEAVSEFLRPYAFKGGVAIEQLGDPDSPEPDALLPEVTVKIYIPGDEDKPALRRQLQEALYMMGRIYPIPPPRFRVLAEQDWSSAWREKFKPFKVSRRFWIQPSWQELERVPAGAMALTLDPGMAFGTGLHPSTQMCLQVLEDMLTPGETVLDVGTGSGILAIAAAKLGASKVVALDVDRLATAAARENVRRNDVAGQVAIYQGTTAALRTQQWDYVVVNILAPVIIALLDEGGLLDHATASGRLILSGIIEDQFTEVKNAIARVDGELCKSLVTRDWVTLVVKKNTP